MGFLDSLVSITEKTTAFSAEAKGVSEGVDKVQKMVDWAYQKSKEDFLGLGTCEEMAMQYLRDYPDINDAIDHLVYWQMATVAVAGFMASLGDASPVPEYAASSAVTVIQLRMVGAIAQMGGYLEDSNERKTAMLLCLLGSQATNGLAKFGAKLTMNAIGKISGDNQKNISKKVGDEQISRMESKSWIQGLVGAGISAIATFAIAQAAKAVFLKKEVDFTKQEQLEIEKARVLINMAKADGKISPAEIELLKSMASSLNLPPKSVALLRAEIAKPGIQKVDFSGLKEDKMNAITLLTGLVRIAKADGSIHPAEKIYISSVAKELDCQDYVVKLLNEDVEKN